MPAGLDGDRSANVTDPGAHLLILGASVRAAAFSALRAGLRPWCVDLFADADLQARCPTAAVPSSRYPAGLTQVARQAPPGPWMYTGALENRPALIRKISQRHPLWGNGAAVLRRARSPRTVKEVLAAAGICRPAVRTAGPPLATRGRWLIKPRKGAGGTGIQFWAGRLPPGCDPGSVYFQEFLEGPPCAAVYVGDKHSAHLLGVTHQLVGEPWLHARPFHYCGSVGPLPLDPVQRQAFDRLGNVLAAGLGLRGLFGVDCILRDAVPWPVEINPRYSASIEVLEYTLGTPALALHRHMFDPIAPDLPMPRTPAQLSPAGKAILFARDTLNFPADGPWMSVLRSPAPLDELPPFADVPRAGERIRAGRPVLTFFARAGSLAACQDTLRQMVRDLDRWLFGS